MALPTRYDPAAIEAKWYTRWEKSGAFRCGVRKNAKPYTIVIPPPNVTGSLHMGHALDNTIQDILIRFERMRGRDVLWQPGVDHAGIATQMVVERELAKEGKSRREMGREAFLERVWQWKEDSGGQIVNQLKRLGASCDWRRSRFTMDEGYKKAVIEKFVTLYEAGLIYRDKRLVNWDPKLLTAISDLEVEMREVEGHFWHFKYPISGEKGKFITVATTRPETMLGDTAVAVHPEDPRYKKLVGKTVDHPLTGRKIPIIADEWADPEQGTGAVKITPAHDFNDFEVARRHDLTMLNVLDAHARLNENAPAAYRGMDRFDAREKVVADLEALGLLAKVEPRTYTAPYGDRSGALIEPWLTDQWYVDAKKLAGPAIKAVEQGKTKFVPKTWEKTFFEWMKNIQPWCISRQLWWGHRIPAWYAPDGTIFVAKSEAEARKQAEKESGKGVTLRQDEDVLDTWFSSALWPFATLGWPDKTPELKRYYPTSVLVTSFDIIFFWVARMMMDGLHFMKEAPFETVYIHALVRDEKGQKMSKSKGNVIDPLEFIGRYGADALRFTFAAMEAQGRDIKLSEARVEGYRNFATKLWNAARFAEMNGAVDSSGFDPKAAKHEVNRWIIGETKKAAEAVTKALEAYRFDAAAEAVYRFTWGTFCDWYVEMTKPAFFEKHFDVKYEREFWKDKKAEMAKVCGWVLDNILILLHPFMPFVTEELWNAFEIKRKSTLILASWPTYKEWPAYEESCQNVNWIIGLISQIRSDRNFLNIPPKAKLVLEILEYSKSSAKKLSQFGEEITQLSGLENIYIRQEPKKTEPAWENKYLIFKKDSELNLTNNILQVVYQDVTAFVDLTGLVNIKKEKDRLSKRLSDHEQEIRALDAKLKNKGFTANAPQAVVAEAKQRLDAELAARDKLKAALARLS